MERASGFISTEELSVDRESGLRYADCGKAMGISLPASRVTYSVLVRGDSSRSTVKVTTRFTNGGGPGPYQTSITECSTKGEWETTFEHEVKEHAEAKK
jgi:hypothetical protein